MSNRILALLREMGSAVYDLSYGGHAAVTGLSTQEDDLWTEVCALINRYQFYEAGLKTDGSVPYPWNEGGDKCASSSVNGCAAGDCASCDQVSE